MGDDDPDGRASARRSSVIGVDIGGATTDVFSVFQERLQPHGERQPRHELLDLATCWPRPGSPNILRWVPFAIDEGDLRNRIKNKMIRPTTIPQTLEELLIEQAIAREALRLAFEQHKSLAVGLKGVQQERTISDTFDQSALGRDADQPDATSTCSSARAACSRTRRAASQSALMMIDAFLPEGDHRAGGRLDLHDAAARRAGRRAAGDPLNEQRRKAATDVFVQDCLIRLGTAVAPIGPGKEGADAA